jgi:hypothetical protein
MIKEEALKLLGKQVKVTLYRDKEHGGPARIVEGKLLGFCEDGEFVIEQSDCFVFYCWPMLDIKAKTSCRYDVNDRCKCAEGGPVVGGF